MRDFMHLLGKEFLFCDGGTGTVLQARGLRGGELPELWNLTRKEDILEIELQDYTRTIFWIFTAGI